MAKAFYPTNDGHIGNLGNLSTIEIHDMIKRHQYLIKKNKAFMSRLPDNGKRIKGLLENLQQELSRRDTQAAGNKADDSVECRPQEYTHGNQHNSIDIQKDCTLSQVRPVPSLVCTNAGSEIKPVEPVGASNQIKQVPLLGSTDANSGHNKPRQLETDLQKLSLVDDDQSKEVVIKTGSLNDSDESRQCKHYYEVAVERAAKNLQARSRQPFKPNRALKIENVKDLPEEIRRMKIPHIVSYDKKEQKKLEYGRGTTHPADPVHPENEESSAVPPCYKFSTTRMIDLTESLQLQEQQKQHQEELNAKLAATKLGERLHVKMEEYNPEGVDMSYRNSSDGHFADDINSDDDTDDDDGVAGMTTLSDTED